MFEDRDQMFARHAVQLTERARTERRIDGKGMPCFFFGVSQVGGREVQARAQIPDVAGALQMVEQVLEVGSRAELRGQLGGGGWCQAGVVQDLDNSAGNCALLGIEAGLEAGEADEVASDLEESTTGERAEGGIDEFGGRAGGYAGAQLAHVESGSQRLRRMVLAHAVENPGDGFLEVAGGEERGTGASDRTILDELLEGDRREGRRMRRVNVQAVFAESSPARE
jgi:hypothetical protein